MCIMTISREGDLELVGLMKQRKLLFLWPALCNNRSRELYGRGRGAALTHFVFVNGGCILFIDAGTRVHLLEAKGLSFTENVFICICYCYNIFEWGGGGRIVLTLLIQWPVMSWKYLSLPLLGILHSVGSVWTASPPYSDSDELIQECRFTAITFKRKRNILNL